MTCDAKRTAFGAQVLSIFAAVGHADRGILPALPAGKINVESHIQNDPDHRGHRGGKADHGQAGVGLNAHEIRHGKADEKGLDQPLDHDPKGLLVSVEVTDHTEQDGGGDGLRGETFQVFKALLDDRRIGGEEARQHIALQHDQNEDHAAKAKAHADPGKHGLFGALGIAGAHILRHEGRHGLHEGAGDQHGEVDDLAGHAVPGGSLQAQAIHKGAQRQEGQLRQALLQRQGQADGQEFAALGIQTDIFSAEGERKLLLQKQYHRADHADGLRNDRGQGRARCVHSEPGYQQQIPENVDHTGHQDEQKRRPAVAQSPENGGEHVVGNDEENAASADAHIAYGQIQRFCGRLHQHGNRAGKADQNNAQHHRDQSKYKSGSAQDGPDLLRLFLTQVPRDQNRNAHGQLRHNECDQVQDLASRRDGGEAGRGTEPAYDQQVHRSVCGLQNKGAENGDHEQKQLPENIALSKIRVFLIQHKRFLPT